MIPELSTENAQPRSEPADPLAVEAASIKAREIAGQALLLEQLAQSLAAEAGNEGAEEEAKQAREQAVAARIMAEIIERELAGAKRDPRTGKSSISLARLSALDTECGRISRSIESEKKQVESAREKIRKAEAEEASKPIVPTVVAGVTAGLSAVVKPFTSTIPTGTMVLRVREVTEPRLVVVQEISWVERGRHWVQQATQQVETLHARATEASPLYARASQWVSEVPQAVVTQVRQVGNSVAHYAGEGWKATQQAYNGLAHQAQEGWKSAKQTYREVKQSAKEALHNARQEVKAFVAETKATAISAHQRAVASLQETGQWISHSVDAALGAAKQAGQAALSMIPGLGAKSSEPKPIRERAPSTLEPVRPVSPTAFQRIREVAASAFEPVRKPAPQAKEPPRKPAKPSAPPPEETLPDRVRKAAASLVGVTATASAALQDLGHLSAPTVSDGLQMLGNIVAP